MFLPSSTPPPSCQHFSHCLRILSARFDCCPISDQEDDYDPYVNWNAIVDQVQDHDPYVTWNAIVVQVQDHNPYDVCLKAVLGQVDDHEDYDTLHFSDGQADNYHHCIPLNILVAI